MELNVTKLDEVGINLGDGGEGGGGLETLGHMPTTIEVLWGLLSNQDLKMIRYPMTAEVFLLARIDKMEVDEHSTPLPNLLEKSDLMEEFHTRKVGHLHIII